MADRSSKIPAVRYTAALALMILMLALVVLGAIVYQSYQYRQLSVHANEYHLRAAGTAADALANLIWFENLLVSRPTAGYARNRDVISYRQLSAERIETLLALEAMHSRDEYAVLVEKLQRQWQAFESATSGLDFDSPQSAQTVHRQSRPLLLTLRQLQRQHEIAHNDLTTELAGKQQAGALTIAAFVLAALAIAAVVSRRVFSLIRRGELRRLEAERALEKYRDDLEMTVAARTSELQNINKELEAFSYSVSHDLRTPLRAIDGFSHVLLEDYGNVLDADGKRYLDRVRVGAQQMGKLIDDLLRLSTINRVSFHPGTADLSALARDIASELRSGDPDRHVRIDIAGGLTCRGDAGLLRIALENLLNNAWKYTGNAAHAHIRFDATQRDGETVFRVRDNGVGFDMRYADKLFSAFQRLHGSAEFDGTGIGLAIVARIVRRHGGRVWAEADVGEGATFYFTIADTPRIVI